MSVWLCRAAVMITVCAGLAGCSAGSGQQEVSGAVTLDGRPVQQGYVRFAPADGKTSSSEVFIQDGRYRTRVTCGPYRVEIYSPRTKGKAAHRPAGPGQEAEEVEETIPARYNARTEL